jgi:hypothetical protein
MRKSIIVIFLIIFVCCGVEGLRLLHLHTYLRGEPAALLQSFDTDETTDGYIRELLIVEGVPGNQINRPTEVLRTALSTLPEGAVLFVVPKDTPNYSVMYATVRYLSLPRPVYYLPCDHPEKAMMPEGEKIAGIISYLIEPPAGTSGNWRLLPRLTMIETKETERWKSYCSR